VSTPINFLVSSGRSGVGSGDSIYAALNGAHLPRVLAAFIGEAVVDFPDKLITIVAALLIAQGLPERQTATAPVGLDLGEAFTFVIRSPGWRRKLLAAAICLLFIWLIVPYLILVGYIIEIARHVRAGGRQLPPWDHPGRNVKDGFKVALVILIWTIPSALLSIPAAIVGAAVSEGSTKALGGSIAVGAGVLEAVGSVWGVLVLLIEAAILSQYLDRGFWAGLQVPGIVRRLRVNIGLSIVVGVLIVMLSSIGVIGLAALVVGVLITYPYASFVGSYLVGQYARLTDRKPDPARSGQPLRV